MNKKNITEVLIVSSAIIVTIILCWCIWYFSPASEHNQIVDVYYENSFYGSFTESEYEKLQSDTYQKYLEIGEQTNSEVFYDDFMPTISIYYNCTYEQWSYWTINNSQLSFDNLKHSFDGGCIINIYFIVENPEVIV